MSIDEPTQVKGMGALIGLSVIGLAQNSALGETMRESKELLNEIKEGQDQLALIGEKQLDVQKRQEAMMRLEMQQKAAARKIKENVFQLKKFIEVIETHSSNVSKFLLYQAAFNSLSSSNLRTELVDDISDKEYIHDTIESIGERSKRVAEALTEDEAVELQTFTSISQEQKKITSSIETAKTQINKNKNEIKKINEGDPSIILAEFVTWEGDLPEKVRKYFTPKVLGVAFIVSSISWWVLPGGAGFLLALFLFLLAVGSFSGLVYMLFRWNFRENATSESSQKKHKRSELIQKTTEQMDALKDQINKEMKGLDKLGIQKKGFSNRYSNLSKSIDLEAF